MHLTIHTDEVNHPQEAKRIAVAVLALAGLTVTDLRNEELRRLVAVDPAAGSDAGAGGGVRANESGRIELVDGDGGLLTDEAAAELASQLFSGASAGDSSPLPPPPPPPPAPSDAAAGPSTSAPTAPAVSSGEVDSKGNPWDARIHAKNKAKKADGTWKSLRGVQQHVVDAVEAERKGAGTPPPPPPPTSTPHEGHGAGTPPPPPPPPPADGATTFPQLVEKIQAATAAGTLSQANLVIKIQDLGVKSLQEVAADASLIERLARSIP